MVPDSREGIVRLSVVPKVVSALRSLVRQTGHRHPVDGKGQVILLRSIGIEPPVVLHIRRGAWADGLVMGDISYAVQPAPDAGVCNGSPAEVLCTDARLYWGSYIESLARDGPAIHWAVCRIFIQTGGRAGLGDQCSVRRRVPGETDVLARNRSDAGSGQSVKLGRFVPSIGCCGRAVANRFVSKEGKQLVFPYRTTNAAT